MNEYEKFRENQRRDYRNALEKFFSSYEQRAAEIKNMELTKKSAQNILSEFNSKWEHWRDFGRLNQSGLNMNDEHRFQLIETDLKNYIYLATNKYHINHNYLERFIDKIKFNILGINK